VEELRKAQASMRERKISQRGFNGKPHIRNVAGEKEGGTKKKDLIYYVATKKGGESKGETECRMPKF